MLLCSKFSCYCQIPQFVDDLALPEGLFGKSVFVLVCGDMITVTFWALVFLMGTKKKSPWVTHF